MTQSILADMPTETRFSERDAQYLAKHRDLLLGFEDKMVQGFYDILYTHPSTLAILQHDQRPMRENVLRNWWQKTLSSEFGNDYWEWQVFVGLVHIKHKVSNAMMMSMWGWLIGFVSTELNGKVDADEKQAIERSFGRLAATVQAMTAESVLVNHLAAITSATGFNPKLLDKLVSLQVEQLIGQRQTA